MNTRIRIIPWVMLVVGFILLSAGVAELYPLCRAAPELPSYSGNCTESRNQEELPPS